MPHMPGAGEVGLAGVPLAAINSDLSALCVSVGCGRPVVETVRSMTSDSLFRISVFAQFF